MNFETDSTAGETAIPHTDMHSFVPQTGSHSAKVLNDSKIEASGPDHLLSRLTIGFCFFDLPAEIRLMIYRFHLVQRHHGRLYLLNIPDADSNFEGRYPPDVGINLLLCSASIYNEARRILYGENTFIIDPIIRPFSYFTRDLSTGGPIARSCSDTFRDCYPSYYALVTMGLKNSSLIRAVEMIIQGGETDINPHDEERPWSLSPNLLTEYLPGLRSRMILYLLSTRVRQVYRTRLTPGDPAETLHTYITGYASRLPQAKETVLDFGLDPELRMLDLSKLWGGHFNLTGPHTLHPDKWTVGASFFRQEQASNATNVEGRTINARRRGLAELPSRRILNTAQIARLYLELLTKLIERKTEANPGE